MSFRNNSSAALWAFALVILVVLLLASHALIRDGGSRVYSDETVFGVIAVCWTGCLLLIAYVSTKPCYRLSFLPDATVLLVRRYPFRIERKIFPVNELALAKVVDLRDAEGQPYFHCQVALPDGVMVDLAESRRRKACVEVAAQFNRTLWSAVDRGADSNFASGG